jgi:hypothetical protein
VTLGLVAVVAFLAPAVRGRGSGGGHRHPQHPGGRVCGHPPVLRHGVPMEGACGWLHDLRGAPVCVALRVAVCAAECVWLCV